MTTIKEIIENDDLSINEKIQELDKLEKDFSLLIEKTIKELTYGCRFCPKCNRFYKTNSWDTGSRPVIEVVNGISITNKDETYLECPVGHRFVDYYDC